MQTTRSHSCDSIFDQIKTAKLARTHSSDSASTSIIQPERLARSHSNNSIVSPLEARVDTSWHSAGQSHHTSVHQLPILRGTREFAPSALYLAPYLISNILSAAQVGRNKKMIDGFLSRNTIMKAAREPVSSCLQKMVDSKFHDKLMSFDTSPTSTREFMLDLTAPNPEATSILNVSNTKFREDQRIYEMFIQWIITSPPSRFPQIEELELDDVPMAFGTNLNSIIEAKLPLPEDSIWRKLLACIPLIGIVSSVINERSLKAKIAATASPQQISDCIIVKNHYKISSIIRECLTVALVVTSVALTVFALPIGLGLIAGAGFIGAGFVGYHSYALYKNKQLIHQLHHRTEEAPGLARRVK